MLTLYIFSSSCGSTWAARMFDGRRCVLGRKRAPSSGRRRSSAASDSGTDTRHTCTSFERVICWGCILQRLPICCCDLVSWTVDSFHKAGWRTDLVALHIGDALVWMYMNIQSTGRTCVFEPIRARLNRRCGWRLNRGCGVRRKEDRAGLPGLGLHWYM